MDKNIQHSIALTKKLLWTIYQYNNLSGYYTDDEANDGYKKDIKELHNQLIKFNYEHNIYPIKTGFYCCDENSLKLLEYQNEKLINLHKKLEYEKQIQDKLESDYYNYMIHYLNLDHINKTKPSDITEEDFKDI